MMISPNPLPQSGVVTKPRYELLDGLRGVAALLVILYHFGEGFATSPVDQMMNHGYLAVDFFFVLSGFVIGYAYDGRWKRGMTSWRFMLRRVVRLHPMVILAVVIGAIAFMLQGSVKWDYTPVPFKDVLVALLAGLFLIPLVPGASADVRGNGEVFPLNGPSWSLLFEYIGSILYAFWLHKLSRNMLWLVVFLSAIGLAICAIGNMSGAYNTGMGWSIANWGFVCGFFRLSFSFSIGLLMSRDFKPKHIHGAFWSCSALLIVVMATPYVGGPEPMVTNALYDCAVTFFVFPLIVWLGACGTTTDRTSTSICNFLGEISYPVYIIHYPAMYLFYAWVWNNNLSFGQAWHMCPVIFIGVIVAAWLALRFYDAPVRAWLTCKWLSTKA